jgi:hypothetical protein
MAGLATERATELLQADKESPLRDNLVSALIGGFGLWLFLSLGLQVIGKMSPYPGATPDWLRRYPIPWHLATLAVSFVVAGALAFAQSRLRKQSLRGAVVTGILMGLLGIVGLLAGGLNAGMFEVAAVRAAVLLLGVVGASILVFVSRKHDRSTIAVTSPL